MLEQIQKRKLLQHSEIVQELFPVRPPRLSMTPWQTALVTVMLSPNASIQVSAKAVCVRAHSPGSWGRAQLCMFQEKSLQGQAHYTKPLKQTHRCRQSDIKGIIKAQNIYIYRNW